ncbi:MAG: hypothetical protein ACTHZX_11900 [Microbacterium sp.]
MGLFGRRREQKADPAVAAALEREAVPELARTTSPLREPLQSAVFAVDPAAADAVYRRATTPEERSWVLDQLGRMIADSARVADWARAGADPTVFGLLSEAFAHEAIGWQTRGTGRASTVGQDSADRFAESLQRGFVRMIEAWRLSGEADTAILAAAQTMLIASDPETVWAHAQRWMRDDPWNMAGWTSLVTQLDARWHGTDQSQLELAFRINRDAPEGDPVHGVVPMLLFQRWSYLLHFGDLTYSEAREQFWVLEPVREILRTAYRKLHETGAYRPGPYELSERNFFAFALYQCGFDAEALREMRALNGRVTLEPWDTRQQGNPLGDFAESREHVIKIVDFGMPLQDGRR